MVFINYNLIYKFYFSTLARSNTSKFKTSKMILHSFSATINRIYNNWAGMFVQFLLGSFTKKFWDTLQNSFALITVQAESKRVLNTFRCNS
ncbi:MAG: hypothetical protein LC096_02070, partial [Bacteroidia bacterium]|nr:hypothetical protein [Bacteroidia bacterium]